MKRGLATSVRSHRRSAFRLPPSALVGITVAVVNRQRRWPVDKSRLKAAVAAVLYGEGITKADVSVAIVSDAAIHQINRQYLRHDEPTDVISFVLDEAGGVIDGEIVVSADTAAAIAEQYGWSPADELLLYAIHGALHLTGYDDLTPKAKRRMRTRERHYLAKFGVKSLSSKSNGANNS